MSGTLPGLAAALFLALAPAAAAQMPPAPAPLVATEAGGWAWDVAPWTTVAGVSRAGGQLWLVLERDDPKTGRRAARMAWNPATGATAPADAALPLEPFARMLVEAGAPAPPTGPHLAMVHDEPQGPRCATNFSWHYELRDARGQAVRSFAVLRRLRRPALEQFTPCVEGDARPPVRRYTARIDAPRLRAAAMPDGTMLVWPAFSDDANLTVLRLGTDGAARLPRGAAIAIVDTPELLAALRGVADPARRHDRALRLVERARVP